VAIPSNRPQNRILLVGGILLALLAGVVVYLAVSNSSKNGNQAATVPVVVAAVQINVGTPFTTTELTVDNYPPQDVPDGSYTSVSTVVGKTAAYSIGKGTPITQSLTTTAGSGTGVTPTSPTTPFTIAQGYVAMAIPASGGSSGASVDQMTVGYYIQAGDQIDIIADLGGPSTSSHAVVYAFQDVPVLSVGYASSAATAPSPTPGATATTSLSAPAYFVVEMPRYQAEMMAAILAGNFAQAAAPTAGSSSTPAPGNAPAVLRYVLRPAANYGTFANNGANFTPLTLPVPSGDVEPVTPSQLAQALGGG